EAKWEADFLCKMQDADGGFYFLVYPTTREYEGNVTPDHGDPQVVWPKNTAVTAASVAALAQCASSPLFKKTYPDAAALYLQKAQLGWTFLNNAIAKYGKNGAYQKITFYGDNFNDADELAWAACEMYLATGDPAIQKTLISWFDPSSSSTWQWGWWHMYERYGNAIRSFAFAAKSGRLQASQLDATFLAKCQTEIATAADNAVLWSQQTAYGTSFPQPTKQVNAAGWYFSEDQAFDMTVAYQLNPRADYLDAIIANMNYEGGCNPVNVSYVSGLGWKRQRIMVDQYALNARHVMPPTGIIAGNVQQSFPFLPLYQSELGGLTFPSDGAATAPYPFYDRWGDTWNVTTEFITLNVARGMANLGFIASLTPTKTQPYVAKAGTIQVPSSVSANVPVTATFQAPAGMDLNGARIVWEALGQEPAYGTSYTFTPTNNGAIWVEAEAQWPDGRRAFATTDSSATNGFPTVTVVATDASAAKATQDPGAWTFTRTGDTSLPLTVNFTFSGTATKWNDFYRFPQGDMPEQFTIPGGSATATLTIHVNPNSTLTGPETAILNILTNTSYNVGTPGSATINLNP
ncbi:MAG: guxA1, partial [Pedosphaera sp.]|nr:guxA1 [Pedosphaera sp.]